MQPRKLLARLYLALSRRLTAVPIALAIACTCVTPAYAVNASAFINGSVTAAGVTTGAGVPLPPEPPEPPLPPDPPELPAFTSTEIVPLGLVPGLLT